MWLPHYLLVFVSIGQLVANTCAFLSPGSKFWRPERHAPAEFLAGTTTGSFLTLPHEQAITAFKTEIATLNTLFQNLRVGDLRHYSNLQKNAYKHLHQVLNYLLHHHSMYLEHLEQWCGALTNIAIENESGFGPISDSILYAFHTLQLRHRRNTHLTEALHGMVSRLMPQPSGILVNVGSWVPWSHELRHPHLGFTREFLSWEHHLKQVSLDEPRLRPLGVAIDENNTGYITQNLKKIIKEIFSIEPANDLSAETRVASIAVLVHLTTNSANKSIKKERAKLMKSLITKRKCYFLLSHERALLGSSLKSLGYSSPINLPEKKVSKRAVCDVNI
ncbi:hypothetical protein PTTG_27485 [Puccinia triticina 1-1 BBBD Race 1]|uniref:Uncharacterized protein n=2 Tax=Puccinia triticina TaxID=208348 RepID=A0A180GKR0_PUCT1|nr:uncharacterized protein PtA15_6A656 [Puccinia triticina]OAV92942.1 hypothetical protein PTTG_27485 [Puccinia triticina 1-1 BBBD Race 1]WAQ86026.1 hypothetical protein PtA15_6A656 [Puccinia triticina]